MPDSLVTRVLQRSLIRRLLVAVFLVPLLLAALFCGSHAYTIYAHNRDADMLRFPSVPPVSSGASLLIISPHPDDETLGAAGLVQAALAAHVPVHLVFLTCGDGFRVGVASYYHEIHVRPSDYVRYGEMRQGEARAALGTLGLPAQDITFLGYPDLGLLPMWRGHWSASDPYTSDYSKASRVPYSDAYHPGSVYCGANVERDLQEIITRDRPTDIYVTHPSDDHPDHSAASAFLNATLTTLAGSGNPELQAVANARVHFYLVHRGDWPVPQGLDEGVPLAPPSQMMGLDTRWNSLNLTAPQTGLKHAALVRYKSQNEMMSRFLQSFVRTNELFGQISSYNSVLPHVDDDQISLNGDARDWPVMTPFDIDPAGDSVIRDFQSGADLRYVYACDDNTTLYVRVDTEAPLSPDVRYNLYLRALNSQGGTNDKGLTVSFSAHDLSAGDVTTLGRGIRAAYSDNTVEYAIPLSDLGKRPDGVYIEAASEFTKIVVDRTGIRCGRLSPPKHSDNGGNAFS